MHMQPYKVEGRQAESKRQNVCRRAQGMALWEGVAWKAGVGGEVVVGGKKSRRRAAGVQ